MTFSEFPKLTHKEKLNIMPYSWILLCFTLSEILSVILFASWLGALPTIILMVLFFFLGFFMLRHIGFSALLLSVDIFRNRQTDISFYQMLWPVRYGIAALCFLLPGFFSDMIGLCLLLPFKGKLNTHFAQRHTAEEVIDGEFSELHPQTKPNDPTSNRITHTP